MGSDDEANRAVKVDASAEESIRAARQALDIWKTDSANQGKIPRSWWVGVVVVVLATSGLLYIHTFRGERLQVDIVSVWLILLLLAAFAFPHLRILQYGDHRMEINDTASTGLQGLVDLIERQQGAIEQVFQMWTTEAISRSVPGATEGDEVNDNLRVLWVDDNPEGNSYEAQSLRSWMQVEYALSTREAMRRISDGGIDAVISDLGRLEDGIYNPSAGLDLGKAIASSGRHLPVYIYTSSRGVRNCPKSERPALIELVTADFYELVLKLGEGLGRFSASSS